MAKSEEIEKPENGRQSEIYEFITEEKMYAIVNISNHRTHRIIGGGGHMHFKPVARIGLPFSSYQGVWTACTTLSQLDNATISSREGLQIGLGKNAHDLWDKAKRNEKDKARLATGLKCKFHNAPAPLSTKFQSRNSGAPRWE